MKTEHIKNISVIAHRYDVFIFDIFGVVHDGGAIFTDTLETISKLSASGKSVFFLSNAPHRASYVAEQLKQVGVDESLYFGILTAGEQTHRYLQSKSASAPMSLGKTCYFVGSQTMVDILPTDGYELTRDINSADFILVAGPETPLSTLENYEAVLREGAKHALPMICGNPDLQVFRKGRHEIRAGHLAAFYQSIGGQVTYCGKPFSEIYNLVGQVFRGVPRKRMLMIGDSFYTDVAGANHAGMDSLLSISKNTLYEIGYNADTIDCPHFAKLVQTLADVQSIPTYFANPLKW